MIDDHGNAVVSDLSEYHGIDLVKVIRDGSISPRMLLARLVTLPDTSALHAAVRGEPRGWGADRHLLATVIDAVQANSYVTASALSGKRGRKPKRVPRPKSKQRRTVSVAELIEKDEGVP